jgi:hypothetical protein
MKPEPDLSEMREYLRGYKLHIEFFHPVTKEVLPFRIPVNLDELTDAEIREAFHNIRQQEQQKRKSRKQKGKEKEKKPNRKKSNHSPWYFDGEDNGVRLDEKPIWYPRYGSITNPYRGGGCSPK